VLDGRVSASLPLALVVGRVARRVHWLQAVTISRRLVQFQIVARPLRRLVAPAERRVRVNTRREVRIFISCASLAHRDGVGVGYGQVALPILRGSR